MHDARLIVLLGMMLTLSAGCPSTRQQPKKESKPSGSPRALAERPAAKRPTVEREAAVLLLPPAEPLPKLAEQPASMILTVSAQEAAVAPMAQAATESRKSSAAPTRTGKHSGMPFDPIKENGPIFDGWPKRPQAAIVITGVEEGYIEPCGCAGLDRMKGGMSRRATFIEGLRKQGWPLVVLDVGGIARGFGRQAEMKFHTMVEGKFRMGYNAIAFGATDLRLPAGELVSVAAGSEGNPSRFVSANVGLFGPPGEINPTNLVVRAGGLRIGVTAILGTKYQQEIKNAEVAFTDPTAALAKIVPELARKAGYLVLLAHATRAESEELGRKFPQFNVVVTSDGPELPPKRAATIAGTKTLLITVGHKGMDAIVLAPLDGPNRTALYQRVPLDSRFPASSEMKILMAAYQDQLKTIGFAELGLRPVAYALSERNGRFVGSAKCESCHEKSYEIWKKSGHGRAYKTLADLDPPRNFDPECVSCHVVGWHPTRFFPYAGGYESPEKTKHLFNTGCEDCHGPGEKHCNAELGSNEKLQETYRKAMVVGKADAKKQQCISCHDLDNSPDFNFDAYWPLIEHKEKE
ncbi:MAG: multiheme c-type cytochrome [Thermoguttaceae bacterium]